MTEERSAEPPESDPQAESLTYKYDVAVSFAGEQRAYVEDVVRALDLPKGRVFYDADYKAALWGEDLAELFTKLYRDEARYVVMFISREYAEKEWGRVERRAALRRRMQTQGAYILPVRLDSTTLDEVAGLLDTIGYLDGLREGVRGVAECLREKLDSVLEELPSSDSEQQIGQIAYDQEGLAALLQRRPHSWQWAAFGSVLVQRRAALRDQLRDYHLGYAERTSERITDFSGLVRVTRNSMHDVEQTGHQLRDLLLTPAFQNIFGDPKNVDEDPDGVVHVANRVMDFYERYVQLAQRTRGISAPSDYINLIDSCARLSDRPLSGLDEFIDEYEKTVAQMPDLLRAAEGEDIHVPVEVKIHMDNALLEDIVQRIKDLREREELGEYGYDDDD